MQSSRFQPSGCRPRLAAPGWRPRPYVTPCPSLFSRPAAPGPAPGPAQLRLTPQAQRQCTTAAIGLVSHPICRGRGTSRACRVSASFEVRSANCAGLPESSSPAAHERPKESEERATVPANKPKGTDEALDAVIGTLTDEDTKQAFVDNRDKLLQEKLTTAARFELTTLQDLKDIGIRLGDAKLIKAVFTAAPTSLPAPQSVRVGRTVAAALALPSRHIYAPPSPTQLQLIVDHLANGEFGILHGHRQAGKTTMAWAVMRRLLELRCEVIHLELPQVLEQRTEDWMWRNILKKLRIQPRPDSSSFEQLQDYLDAKEDCRLCLVVDEADELAQFDSAVLLRLMARLRVLKQRPSNPLGCLMVGTSFVEHLLCTGLDQDNTSPFNAKFAHEPPRFVRKEVQSLVVQLLQERDKAIQMSTTALAQAILACTDGHRGLVGVCLKEVELMLIVGYPVTVQTWQEAEARLPINMMAGSNATYNRIVKDLLKYQQQPGVQHILKAMLHNAGVCSLDPLCCQQLEHGEAAWERLVWAGIVVGPDCHDKLRMSSPLLLRACMAAAVQPTNFTALGAPPAGITSRSVTKWMLVEGVARMPLTCALAPELASTAGQPAEYGLRADLSATINTVLSLTPRLSQYRALPEVQIAKDDPRKKGSAPRLDYYYKNGGLPKILMEYYVCPRLRGAQNALDVMYSHLASSQMYAAKLEGTCYMVAMSVEEAGKPVPAAVVPVDVALRVEQGVGLVRFQDSAMVHRVELVGRREEAELSFDTHRWRRLRAEYQTIPLISDE